MIYLWLIFFLPISWWCAYPMKMKHSYPMITQHWHFLYYKCASSHTFQFEGVSLWKNYALNSLDGERISHVSKLSIFSHISIWKYYSWTSLDGERTSHLSKLCIFSHSAIWGGRVQTGFKNLRNMLPFIFSVL